MKVAVIALALLQATGLAPLLAARQACARHDARPAHHDARPAHHASHEPVAAAGEAPVHLDDCAHCPPADCARHLACGPVTVAVVPTLVATPVAPAGVDDERDEQRLARGQPPNPPVRPPRLIA